MRYKILESSRYEELEEDVIRLMKSNWLPQGGVCFHQTIMEGRAYSLFYQAMIKDWD